jgi:signal transduction histidine kinase
LQIFQNCNLPNKTISPLFLFLEKEDFLTIKEIYFMKANSAQDIVKTIQAILNVDQFLIGEEYFKALVRNVAKYLNVKYCFIGRPLQEDQTKVQTYVVWAGNQFANNFVYDLVGTPCKNVLDGQRVGFYSPNVAGQFPEDELLAQMGVESYLGAPVIDAKNNLLGLIVILDDLPIEDRDYYSAIMELMAGRVASEIERNDLQVNLKQQVEERTAELNAKIEELQRTRHELIQSEKMASLGRLVAGFAHELNTPMGVAVSSASVLQGKSNEINNLLSQDEVDGEALDAILAQFSQATNLIVSNLKRASELVNSFKRTAVDQSSEDIRQFNVKSTLEDVINTLQSKFRTTDININLNCPEDLQIYSIPGMLDQVLTNLMLNSLEHGFNRGEKSGHIQISAQLKQDRLQVIFSDNGKGISEENLKNIFEPFFTTNRSQGGSGLGLYISYNLITSQLKGNMSCESTPDHGSTFKIEFPVQFSLK